MAWPYAFKLRSGLIWSDSQPITADDSEASVKRVFSLGRAGLISLLGHPLLRGIYDGCGGGCSGIPNDTVDEVISSQITVVMDFGKTQITWETT